MTVVEPKPYYAEDRILAKMPPALKPLARKLNFTDLCLFYWVWGKLQRGLPLENSAEKYEAHRIFGQAGRNFTDDELTLVIRNTYSPVSDADLTKAVSKAVKKQHKNLSPNTQIYQSVQAQRLADLRANMHPDAVAEWKQRATPNLAYFQMDAPKVFDPKDPLFSVRFAEQVNATKKVFAAHWPKDHTAARSQERVKEGIIKYGSLMPYIQGNGYVGTTAFFFPQEVYDRIRGKKANIADERLFPTRARERVDVNTAQKAFDYLIGEFKDAKQTEACSPIKLVTRSTREDIVFAGQGSWSLSLSPLTLLNLAGYTRFEVVMSQRGSFQIKDADTGEVLAYAMPVSLK
jgi:hypothetical protein